ncbi:MAG: hypothetical protein ACI8WB_003780 [Phenylobacterium sp.]|jgi:hypothetical protein
MKLRQLISLIPLTIALIATPLSVQAKEHNGEKKSSRHVVVNNSKHHNGHSNKHHRTRSHKRSYNNHHSSGHHSYKHHSYKRRNNNLASAIVLGAALHHGFGIHGSHYNGHAWCPSHHLYHTHNISYRYNNNHHYDNGPRKVDSYIEEDEGRCFRVTEYNNGDERKKRIRDHLCDEMGWEDE